ncbi:MAG: 30S ribosomal protein S3 [Clostridia bacterium]|nr:MAG: 30S ribosomal protein S3 [Clostridia bacterium]
MGQKVNPKGLRLGIVRDWDARWYSEKDFSRILLEDVRIRRYLKEKLFSAGVSTIEIERAANRVRITVHTARPGIVIGRGGTEVENLRQQLENLTGKQVHLNIVEIKRPELDAQLVAENIAAQLQRRVSFRRVMKQTVSRSMRMGAQGVKVCCAGRLGGAEMARTEWHAEGKVPLHTLRADIDYGFAEAKTTYGVVGVKVWIYKGDILPEKGGRTNADAKEDKASQRAAR